VGRGGVYKAYMINMLCMHACLFIRFTAVDQFL
jgi:hypothetical protein